MGDHRSCCDDADRRGQFGATRSTGRSSAVIKEMLISRMQRRADCFPLCGLDNSRIARSGRPLDFLRYHNKLLKQFHLHHTAQHRLLHCNLLGLCATAMTPPVPLLSRLPLSRLRSQEVRRAREGQPRLSRLEDPEVQAHPAGQVELGRRPSIQPLKWRPSISEKAAWMFLSRFSKRTFYSASSG
jgi:hypothetical protein